MVNIRRHLCIAVLGLAIIGCSSTTDTPPVTPIVSPKAGSYFIFERKTIVDSSNVVKEITIDTFKVIATGIQFEGRTATSVSNGPEISYIAYGNDGDIELWNAGGNPAGRRKGWMRVPIGTKGQHTFVEIDTIEANGFHRKESITHTYIGEATVTAANQTFETAKVRYYEVSTRASESPYTDHTYYSRTLGFFVESKSERGPVNGKGNHHHFKLIAYKLQ